MNRNIIIPFRRLLFPSSPAPQMPRLTRSSSMSEQQQNTFREYSFSQADSVPTPAGYSFATKKTLRFDATQTPSTLANNAGTQSGGLSSSIVNSSRKNAVKTLDLIRSWRAKNVAPVDVVGCEVLHDKNEPVQVQKYQTLVALMLSVQTKDETTGKVMERLKKYGLKPQIMAQMQEEKLVELIRESNFNRRKAKNIIEVSKRILAHGLPKTQEQVIQYPGVGIKIALLYMKVAEGVTQGIGVDTHVHRISNRLGWVKAKAPEETEKQLQQLFSQEHWDDINLTMVGLGQLICDAKKPKCRQCPVKLVCPSSRVSFKDEQ